VIAICLQIIRITQITGNCSKVLQEMQVKCGLVEMSDDLVGNLRNDCVA